MISFAIRLLTVDCVNTFKKKASQKRKEKVRVDLSTNDSDLLKKKKFK